jgi:hypothetical protein
MENMMNGPRFLFTHGTFATILCFLISSSTHGADLLDFKTLHYQYVSRYASDLETQSLSGHSLTYYETSYYLHGMLSAIEATNDEVMLRKVIHYIDNMLSKAIVNKASYKVWAPLGPPLAADDAPVQLYVYKACGPIARVAALIMRNPSFKTKYSAVAIRYINFVDETIIRYWYLRTYGGQIPHLPADLGGWGTESPSWSDKTSHLGQIAASLYAATRIAPMRHTSLYLDVATRIATAFKRKLQMQGTGWIWDNGTAHPESGQNTQLVPDTSHANDEARLVVFMHEAGIIFTLDDLQKFANTLTDTIWNGSTDNPMFSNYINGSNATYRGRTAAGANGGVYHGWALIGKYSTKAQTALSYLLKSIVEGKRNPSIDENACCGYAKVALTGHLLRNSSALLLFTPIKVVGTPAR